MSQQLSRNEHHPFELSLNQEMTMDTICRDLITAGVLLPEEKERYKAVLRKYDPITLVKVLLESHMLKDAHEEAQH